MNLENFVDCIHVERFFNFGSVIDPEVLCGGAALALGHACRRARAAPPNMAMAATAGSTTSSSVDQVKNQMGNASENLLRQDRRESRS